MHRPVSYIEVEDPGQRIDNFLFKTLKSVPKTRIYRMLRRGEVRVNGSRVKPAYRLQEGDRVRVPPVRISVSPPPPRPSSDLTATLEAAVLFEDENLLALDKPSGLAVHGGSGIRLGAIEALRSARPGQFLELAHRLDRDTSGCLLLAKSRSGLQELHAILRERRAKKTYDLLVFGGWPKKLATVQLKLHRYVAGNGERRVRVAAQGKPARTDFRVESAHESVTWLKARLHTGRTHQIRVHAAASGHPLLGEEKYATEASAELSNAMSVDRLCLHATSLALPWCGKTLRIQAPVPELFADVWARLH